MASISLAFTAKKEKILRDLSAPDSEYTDSSPKGSVDEAIRSLIDEINSMDGIVTTSSCAGRISIFLEGGKSSEREATEDVDQAYTSKNNAVQAAVPGGKGMGGRWLFVSHDPVPIPSSNEGSPLLQSFQDTPRGHMPVDCKGVRLVKFQFEPMILHIMTASLHHAQPVLSAAINAGFRESGVQSLKSLDDANAFPMVAVRSAGLALSSVVGFADEGSPVPHCLVSDEYLRLLLNLGNERFVSNAERIGRFRASLRQANAGTATVWENRDSRAKRKRAEGLKQRARTNKETMNRETEDSILSSANALFQNTNETIG